MEKQESATTPHKTERASTSIDWLTEGESRVVEVDGVRVSIKFVARRGRRARIAITAPVGAVFEAD